MSAIAPVRVVLGTMTFAVSTAKPEAHAMLKAFAKSPVALANPEVDTARMYADGKTEEMIGDILREDPELGSAISIATKVNAFGDNLLSEASLNQQANACLTAMGVAKVDVFYLHAPDPDTCIEETLKVVQDLFTAGKFNRLALSNFTAWETVWIHGYMKEKGWVIPTIYQGMYNAITRQVEQDLFPALHRLGMSFYAYNPLAGGMLTGKWSREGEGAEGGDRFREGSKFGKMYKDRYMKEGQFDALDVIRPACEAAGISMAEASMRWMMHHSFLSGKCGDALIIGASSMGHFEANLVSLEKGPLPSEVVEAMDKGWDACKSSCPPFARGVSGFSKSKAETA